MDSKNWPIFLVLASLAAFCGCSTLRHQALDIAAPLFLEGAAGFEEEGDWESFREGVPGNLKILEGFLAIRPKNKDLLVAATKGWSGYSFAVHETLYLEDKWAEKDSSKHFHRALSGYSKAVHYGLRFLEEEGVSYGDLEKALREKGGIPLFLEGRLSSHQRNLEGVLFTAQALGGLINLQRDNMKLVASLPLAKGLFDWVCTHRPSIANGVCPIFYASYESGRPRMLGGNPERGKKLFEELIKKNPHNWLARVAFLEHYIIPMSHEDLYKKQKSILENYQTLHRKKENWLPHAGTHAHPAFARKRLRIYQAIAMKRFEIMKKYESDIF